MARVVPGFSAGSAQPPHWAAPGHTRTVKINGMNVHEEALIVDAPTDFAFTILRWPLPMARSAAERVQIEDTSRDGERRVRLTYTGAFDLNRFGRLIWPMLEPRMASGWGEAFENIHQRLAAGDTTE